MPKIKDLSQYLTQITGLSPEERAEWRATIDRLFEEFGKETDAVKKKQLQNEAVAVFQSMSYWKEKYAKKEEIKPLFNTSK